MKCKSGKHEWISKENARKCCNGYRRLLRVGSRYDKFFFTHYWVKEEDLIDVDTNIDKLIDNLEPSNQEILDFLMKDSRIKDEEKK